jgi:hypothetical protein
MRDLRSRLQRSLRAFVREWRAPEHGGYVSYQTRVSALPPGVTMTSGKGAVGRRTSDGRGRLTEYTSGQTWTKPRQQG